MNNTLKVTTPTDREVMITREFDAPRQLVWDAMSKPEILKRWLFGPPGWEMTVCEEDRRVGGHFRWGWKGPNGEEMSMHGEYREVIPPIRVVRTEIFEMGCASQGTEVIGSMVLAEKDRRTTITITVLYPTKECRDAALASGMDQGLKAGYARVDEILATMPAPRDVEDEGANLTMRTTRVFNAPVKHVWKAWSESGLVKQWWGPTGFSCPVANIDFRVGGVSLICMRAPREFGGMDMYSTWTYTRIEPHTRIELTHRFSDEHSRPMSPASMSVPAGVPAEVPHVITFKALDDNRTELNIVEYGYTTEQAANLSKMGMEQCLDKMAEAIIAIA